MKNLYLFSILNQSFKEKNLLFEEGEKAAPAEAADKPKEKETEVEDKDKKTEKEPISKSDVTDKLETLKTQLGVVSDAEEGTYTKKTVDAAKALGSQVSKIENQLKKFKEDDADVSKAISQATLDKFDKAVDETFSDESLEADAEKKKALDEARESLNTKKEEADPAAICEKVKEMVKKPEDADKNTAKIYDAILARYKDGKGLKLEGTFKAIEAKLAKAEAEPDAEKAKELAEEANSEIKLITPETIAGFYPDLIDNYTALTTLAGDGKHGKEESAKIATDIAQWIKTEKDENSISTTKFNEKFKERAIIAKACDIISTDDLDVSPESLNAAISNYESGEHKPANRNEKRDKILKALVEKKDELNNADIYFNINAGTDGTDWSEKSSKRNEEWHDATKSALEKLLALYSNDKLYIKDSNGNDITLSDEQIALIKEYNDTEAKDREAFAAENKAEFLNHGGIFDLALNIQRAREMKERLYAERDEKGEITNAKDLDLADDEDLDIKLGSTPSKREERKSGITFYKAEPKDDANNTQDAPAPGPNDIPADKKADQSQPAPADKKTDEAAYPPADVTPSGSPDKKDSPPPAEDPQPDSKVEGEVEGKVEGATAEVVVSLEKMTDAQLLYNASRSPYQKADENGFEHSVDEKFARKKLNGSDTYTYWTSIRTESADMRRLN